MIQAIIDSSAHTNLAWASTHTLRYRAGQQETPCHTIDNTEPTRHTTPR